MRKVAYRNLGRVAQNDADKLVTLMRAAEPTAFALEADAVFALRSIRCLSGWAFDAADTVARDVVHVSLNLSGAVRPSWEDGQPIAIAGDRGGCVACGLPLYGQEELFCGDRCRDALHNSHKAAVVSAERAAFRAGLACRVCGGAIRRAARNDAKYCSSRCQFKAKTLAAPVKVCVVCHQTFQKVERRGEPAEPCCSARCRRRWNYAIRLVAPRPVRCGSAESAAASGFTVDEIRAHLLPDRQVDRKAYLAEYHRRRKAAEARDVLPARAARPD